VNVAYSVLGIDGAMYMLDIWCCVHVILCAWWICVIVCIWYSAYVGYAVLCIYDPMYMLDMQCYVHMVLYACCTCGAMYIWCGVHDCISGFVCMYYCVHVVQVALCAGSFVYMSCMWRCVHVVSCTCVHMVLCICCIVYTLYRWCSVHVALCKHCVGGATYM